MIFVDAREIEGKSYGVGRYLRNLLLCWEKESEHFTLIFRSHPPRCSSCYASVVLPGPDGWRWENLILPRLLRKFPSAVYFNPGYTLPIPVTNPMAMVLHDVSFLAHPEWFRPKERLKLKILSRLSAAKAAVIFTVSSFSRQQIIEFLKVEESRIVLAPQGLDPAFKPDEEAARAFRRKYGIEGPIILYVGAIFARRNLPLLVKAFKIVKRSCRDCRLVIIGENRSYPPLDLSDLFSGVEDLVHLSYVEERELIGAYTAAEVLVYPSEYEGFGMPPMEAMACSTPAILYPAEALVEVYEDSVVWLESKQPEELAEKILLLMENQTLRDRLLEKGRKIISKFSWKRTAELIKEKLLELE